MITSLPPLEAFRRDTVHLSSQDQTPARPAAWLSAAILLHRWSESSTAERAELREGLERVLEQTLVPAARPAPYSSPSRASDGWIAWAARQIANEAEDAGAYHLAWTILTGVEYAFTGQSVVFQGVAHSYVKIGANSSLGLSNQVWIALAVAVILWILLDATEIGR